MKHGSGNVMIRGRVAAKQVVGIASTSNAASFQEADFRDWWTIQ